MGSNMSKKQGIDPPSSSRESVPMDLEKTSNERLEERRNLMKMKQNEDLLIIRDQCNSLEDKTPFPETAFDSLVQNNIWEDVLPYFNSTRDISNMYLTCTTFRHYYEKRQEAPVLDEVLKIIRASGYLPFKTKKDRKNVLHLRMLSKAWKKAVDSEFFGATFTEPSWYLKVRFTDWENEQAELHYFQSEEELDQAIKMLGHGHDNSFMRSIFIDAENIDDPMELECFQLKCIHLLDIVGEHVYSFRYRGNLMGPIVNSLRSLLEMMNRMPYMKALILSQRKSSNDIEMTTDAYRYLRENFAPKLKYLKHCEMDHLPFSRWHLGNEIFVGAVIRHSMATLKSLVIGLNEGMVVYVPANLRTQFNVERYEGNIVDGFVTRAIMSPLRWPLKVLRVPHIPTREIDFFRNDCIKQYNTALLMLLRFFRATLETLELNIKLCKCDIGRELPKLRDLTVFEISKDTLSVDDLLHIKSLEKLKIRNYRGDEEGEETTSELVKLKGLAKDRLGDSNIWRLFPNLKEVTIVNYGVTYLRYGSTVVTRRYRDRPVKMEVD